MNRAQRRQAARRQRIPDSVQHFATSYVCPDCDADTNLVEEPDGVFILNVAHDTTCPSYGAMTRPKENR